MNERANVRKTNARNYEDARTHKRMSERTHVLTNESTYDRKNARMHKNMDAQTEKYY